MAGSIYQGGVSMGVEGVSMGVEGVNGRVQPELKGGTCSPLQFETQLIMSC